MQTISLQHLTHERPFNVKSLSIVKWLNAITPTIVENRFGVVVTLILIQVTLAGFNVVIPPMANASVWIMAPGIAMTFISNSMALAQMRLRWVLIGFALSIVINTFVSLFYAIQLF